MNYHGQRATIMGLGRFGGGLAAARWLASQGAQVIVSDSAASQTLSDSLTQLANVPIAAYRFGGHHADDFRGADLVVVNPAVHPDNPWLQVARNEKARLVSEIELFLENCPAPTIGVTGSNGKSTTAAMTADILEAAGHRTFLGGNIGVSLLGRLSEIKASDWVVLELSSFQLWHFTATANIPRIAVVTGFSPNHLDWHGSLAHYRAAKQRLLTGQTSMDWAVLNAHDPEVGSWSKCVVGQHMSLPKLHELPPLQVPGEHNRKNAACAAAAARAAGCPREAIEHGLKHFGGLPQRLEMAALVDGRRFYNDSTATTPESTMAALRSLDTPIWLLAGGKSKGFDFGTLARDIVGRAKGAAFFGEAREELLSGVAAVHRDFRATAVATMEQALEWCWRQSKPGEAIVLSPGCASTDQFRNFRHRGQCFAEGVDRLEKTVHASPLS